MAALFFSDCRLALVDAGPDLRTERMLMLHIGPATSRSRQTDLHSPHAALGPRAASRQLSSALAANAVLARFPVLRGCFVAGAALFRPLFTTHFAYGIRLHTLTATSNREQAASRRDRESPHLRHQASFATRDDAHVHDDP